MVILGLHLDRPYLRLAVIEAKTKKKVTIRSLKSAPIDDDDDVKELYIKGWKGDIATGINALVRTLSFSIPSIKKIEEGLPFQIETLTHLPIDQITYAYWILEKEKTVREATIFFTPKDFLKEHLEEWKSFSVEPDFVTSNAQALVAFAKYRCPDLASAFLVDIGSQWLNCAWMEEGVIKKSFTIPSGVEALLSSLWEDRKKVLFKKEIDGAARQIDLLQLKNFLNPHLTEKLESLRRSLAGVFFSLQQAVGPRPVFFTGRTNAFGHLTEFLIEKSPELSIYHPPIPLTIEESVCATAIGLSLELSAKRHRSIQFLKEEFIPRKTWRRAGIAAISLAFCSMLLSGVLLWIGSHQINSKKWVMAESLRKIGDPKILRTVQAGNLDQGIEQALAIIEKNDNEAPFLLQAPAVSEFLHWLSELTILKSSANEADPIEIMEVRYQLASYPHIGSMKEPFKAKVIIEFRTKSQMNARKFHESLLKEGHLIDQTELIDWEATPEGYRATFYLVNRIPYVQ